MTVHLKLALDDPYLVLPGEGLLVPTLTQDEMIQALAEAKHRATPSFSSTPSLPSSSLSTSSYSTIINPTAASLLPATLTESINTEDDPTHKYTTPLSGTLTLRITKPTEVHANAIIKLRGTSHLSLVGCAGKRAHTFQPHLELTQSLPLQPPQLPEPLTSNGQGQVVAQGLLHDPASTSEPRFLLLQPGILKVPFILQVPNLAPPSVTTPEGGTFYRLSALLTTTSGSLSASVTPTSSSSNRTSIMSKLKSRLSISSGSTNSNSNEIKVFDNIKIYRAPRSRCLYVQQNAVLAEERALAVETVVSNPTSRTISPPAPNHSTTNQQEQEEQVEMEDDDYDQELIEDANDLVPVTVYDHFPRHLESTISIPFTQLLKESDPPEIKVQIALLNPAIKLKSFQITLWERAIYRVQRKAEEEVFEAAVKAGIVDPFASRKRYVIGIRERAVNAQRADASLWEPSSEPRQQQLSPENVVAGFEKKFSFSVPDPHSANSYAMIRKGPAAGWGNTNSSTYTHVSKLKRVQRYEEDKTIKDEEFGRVHIEIQHFIRYTVKYLEPSTPAMTEKRRRKMSLTQEVEKERILGQVPVILHGLPTGPESDKTGLPSYLTSFTSDEVSVENTIKYEQEAISFLPSPREMNDNGTTTQANNNEQQVQQAQQQDASMDTLSERLVEALALPTYEDTVSSTTHPDSKRGHVISQREP
ncbi:hypothetical protein BGZ83_008221 [Gryganskiella cystojenkinii]|nr:hypothetical protein BGZ83_008221 [Gryganskiella cystojenkinii]